MGTLVVTIDKGMLSGVFTDTPEEFRNMRIVAVDYDTDGASMEAIRRVRGPDGVVAEAYVVSVEVEEGRFAGIDL